MDATKNVNNKKVRLEDDLSEKVAKFQKRLTETDPVSGAPRYGESMTGKVRKTEGDGFNIATVMYSRFELNKRLVRSEKWKVTDMKRVLFFWVVTIFLPVLLHRMGKIYNGMGPIS